MTDTAPTADASVTESAPSSVDSSGASEGTQAADSFVAERERYEQQLRDLEAQRSRFQGELDRAKAELAKAKSSAPAGDAGSSKPLTLEEMRAEIARSANLTATSTVLRTDESVKHADPVLFDRALEYDSPEAFRVAVEESHRERAALIEIGRKAALEERGLGEQPNLAPADSGSTHPTPGMPTKEALAQMPPEQFDAFVDKHGDAVVEQILRS